MRLQPFAYKFDTLRRIVESGLVGPTMPDRLVKAGIALWKAGNTAEAIAALEQADIHATASGLPRINSVLTVP